MTNNDVDRCTKCNSIDYRYAEFNENLYGKCLCL